MKLRHEATYDADVAAVFAALTDPDFLVRKSEAVKATGIRVSAEPTDDGGVATTLARTVEVDLPGIAKKALGGGRVTFVDAQQWRPADAFGSRTASAEGMLEGHGPGFIGTVSVVGDDSGKATVIVDGNVEVRVPLVAGRLEKIVVGLVTKMLDSDQRELTRWLAEH
jgi:hypothetical protein